MANSNLPDCPNSRNHRSHLLATSTAARLQTLGMGVVVTLIVAGALVAGQSSRTPGADGARLSGTVTARDSGRPLQRAQVRLVPIEGTATTTTTDQDGQFEFANVRPGKYRITASNGGYLTVQYGQRALFEPGQVVTVATGEQFRGINVSLPPGGVITGTITSDSADPIVGAVVQALREKYSKGRRILVPAARLGRTDDRGQFRIFGLVPGTYYLAVGGTVMPSGATAVQRRVARSGMDRGASPGLVTAPVLPASRDDSEGFAPTYFPGTTSLAEASRLTVGAGEELTGITFGPHWARFASIAGEVRNSTNRPLGDGLVELTSADGTPLPPGVSTSAAVTSGSFNISRVPPGNYRLLVTTAAQADAQVVDREFASVSVSVDGGDISGLAIATRSGATITGRVFFEGGEPSNGTGPLLIKAVPLDDVSERASGVRKAQVGADRVFELRGVVGVNIFDFEGVPDGWALKSVSLAGADITDSGHAFDGSSGVADLDVRLTNRLTRLTGLTLDRRSAPVPDTTVLVFSSNRGHWSPHSRFTRIVRSTVDGQFEIVGLPPGDYLAVLLLSTGSEDGEIGPSLFEQLTPQATALSLRDGEQRQMTLVLP